MADVRIHSTQKLRYVEVHEEVTERPVTLFSE